MRIEEINSSIVDELSKDNEKLYKKNKELSRDLIIYKDRNHNMTKAIVTLSLITFFALVILVIVGYNYAINLTDTNFKLAEHEKTAQEHQLAQEEKQAQIDEYDYQLKDQNNIIKELREDNDKLSKEISELKSKINNMNKTIDSQKNIIDRYRDKSSDENYEAE